MTVVTPLSTRPTNGSKTSVSCTGSSKSTTIPTAVSVWQMAIVARLPSQLPIHPQASFPAAPRIQVGIDHRAPWTEFSVHTGGHPHMKRLRTLSRTPGKALRTFGAYPTSPPVLVDSLIHEMPRTVRP